MNIRKYKFSKIALISMISFLWSSGVGLFAEGLKDLGGEILEIKNDTNYNIRVSNLVFVSEWGGEWVGDQVIPAKKNSTIIRPGNVCPYWLSSDIRKHPCWFGRKVASNRSSWFEVSTQNFPTYLTMINYFSSTSGEFAVDPNCNASHGDSKCATIKWNALWTGNNWQISFSESTESTGRIPKK